MANENAFEMIDEFRDYLNQLEMVTKQVNVAMAAVLATNDADDRKASMGTLNRLETTRASVIERAEAVKERLEKFLGPV
jgi:hypothetical protein